MFMGIKQLYIEDDQERRLQQRAQQLGISESEFVRRAIESALANGMLTPPSVHLAALTALLDSADEIVANKRPVLTEPFSRDEIYVEREAKLFPQ
jgi:hypothetical protein